MQANQLTEETLRSLSEVEADEPVIVSMFISLDPSEFATPPARASQFNSLLNTLDERIRDDALSSDARQALRGDRERIEGFLSDLDASDAQSIAVYSAQALDFFAAVKLATPLDPGVHVDLRPQLEPLLGLEDEGEWCALLVTRDMGRLFRGGPTGLREIRDIESDVKGQHKAGGWSQARWERSVEREVDWHLEDVGELLFGYFKRRPFEHLVIGANESLRPVLTEQLHAYLLERVRGWVDVDERLATEEEAFEAVREVMDAHFAEHQRELFERYRAERGTDGRSATGITEVLSALVEQRVESLIVREGAEAPGTKCVTCGWMGPAGPERCPVDGTALDALDNIVDPAIQSAIQQSAHVHVIRDPQSPQSSGEIPFEGPMAALLRY